MEGGEVEKKKHRKTPTRAGARNREICGGNLT
jgi:hypothetical protein